LVKNESGAAEAYNGVYTVTQTGSGAAPYILTRATDFDSSGSGVDQIDAGDFFLVTAGSTQANTSWVQQTPLPITVGTTAIVFTQFAAPVLYSAGTGLTLTGTTFSITNTGVSASTYGSASSVPVLAINAQGQVTSASSSSIAIAASQITSGAVAIANGGTGATSAATALTNLGAYPASNPAGYTSNTGTVTSVNLTAGTGVSVSGGPITASGSITVTNTAPDQVVSLTGSGATTVTGTYPNFTISSPTAGAGTVTSIDVSGGTTGLTTSGGPVTSSGTITLAGTLNVANGGTGATTLSSGYVLKGNGTSAVSASVIYDNGTNVGVGTTSPLAKLDVNGQGLFQGSTVPAYRGANIGALNINNNSADGTVDFTQGLVFTDNTNNTGAWAHAGIVATGSAGFRGNLVFGTDNDGTQANVITERMRITDAGNVGLNTTTPTGRISVVSGSSTGASTSAWSGNYSVFGPNAGSTTGAAVALGYNSSADAAEILALAPAVAWKPLNLYSAGLNLYASSGGIGASLNGSGTFSAVTDIRAPIFYDSNDTAYYADFAGSTAIFSNGVIVAGTQGFQSRIVTVGDRNRIWSFNNADAFGLSYFQGTAGTGGASTIGLHFGTATAAASTLQVVANSYTLSLGSMRSPIFYDSDNTAFYADMAGTSEFNTIQTRGGSGFRTFATPSAGINSQLYFADAGNTRAWNWQLDENSAAALWNYDGSSWQKRFTFTSGSNLTVGGNIQANAGIFTNDGASRVLYLKGSGNIIQFQDADGTNRWENVGRNGTYYVYKGYGTGLGFKWQIDDNGNHTFTGIATFNTDVRAPIFYDSNNTGYYLDPASGSNLNGTLVNSGGTAMTAGWNRNMMLAATFPVLVFNSANAKYSGIGVDYTSAAAGMYFWVNGSSSDVTGTGTIALGINTGNFVTAFGSSRAPIFYDSDNTGFYIDAASTSSLVTLLTQNLGVYDGGVTNDPYGKVSVTRATDANYSYYGLTRSGQHVVGMGIDTSNQFWIGGVSAGGYNSTRASSWLLMTTGGNVTAPVDMRSPFFYDSNDTAYYVDPNGNTRLNQLLLAGPIATINNFSPANSAIRLTPNLHLNATAGHAIIVNWDNGTTSGLTFRIGNGAGSDVFTTYANGAVYASIIYDISNSAYYLDPAGFSNMSSANGMWMCGTTNPADTINGSTWYGTGRNNLDQVQLAGYYGIRLRTAGAIMDLAGDYAQINGSYRAPIYYDSTNTAYYWNFADAAGSFISTIITGFAYFQSNRNTSSAEAPLQAYSTGGLGATMAFHRAGVFAVNMGLDSDNVFRIGGWSASNNLIQLDMSGNFTALGNVTAYSDIRMKKDVETIADALGLVRKMRGVTYTRIDTDKAGVGVIAQEMLEVMPQVVQQGAGDNDTLSVAYGNLVGVLIEAIKELEARVAELEGK